MPGDIINHGTLIIADSKRIPFLTQRLKQGRKKRKSESMKMAEDLGLNALQKRLSTATSQAGGN